MKSASSIERKKLQDAIQINEIYYIFGNGKRVGISVAPNEAIALAHAKTSLTRKTVSKEDFPDYENITVQRMNND